MSNQKLTQPTATASTTTTLQRYEIDPSHSAAEFAVKHLMIATVKGHVAVARGSVAFDPANVAATTIEAELPMASIDTRDEKRDAHLRSPDFINVDKYPVITFKSTRVERGGAGLRVTGDLTIAGVTRPVTLDVEDQGRAKDPWGNEKAAYSATTKIKRSEFGLKWNVALETGGVLVGDDVKISIEAQLAKTQG